MIGNVPSFFCCLMASVADERNGTESGQLKKVRNYSFCLLK